MVVVVSTTFGGNNLQYVLESLGYSHSEPVIQFVETKLKRSSLVMQQVKVLVLSLQQFQLLLWHSFPPWPGNFFFFSFAFL